MHEGLRFRTLSKLPPALRVHFEVDTAYIKLALAACATNASLHAVRRFLAATADASKPDGRTCLAAFYVLLDPAQTPPLEPFEPTIINRAVGQVLEVLPALYRIKVPGELGFELWLRVWAWIHSIYTYKDHLPGPPLPKATFCIGFLIYTTEFWANHEPAPFICDSVGFKSMVTVVWGFLLDANNRQTRDLGLSQISSLLPGDDAIRFVAHRRRKNREVEPLKEPFHKVLVGEAEEQPIVARQLAKLNGITADAGESGEPSRIKEIDGETVENVVGSNDGLNVLGGQFTLRAHGKRVGKEKYVLYAGNPATEWGSLPNLSLWLQLHPRIHYIGFVEFIKTHHLLSFCCTFCILFQSTISQYSMIVSIDSSPLWNPLLLQTGWLDFG
ncbi:hypothetical protein C8R43DRAFT_1147723 [Mycena crocata]|nr:hypothetical protein C8R43DRAFT_1147723 [Mycena crocata]